MDWQAFALSLRLATVTTAILVAIAVPLAALLVLGRGRWLAALEALATLPMVLPPTVLGFFLLVLLGPRTAVGRGISAMLDIAAMAQPHAVAMAPHNYNSTLIGLAATDGRLIRPSDEPTTAKIAFDWSDVLNEGLVRNEELRQEKFRIVLLQIQEQVVHLLQRDKQHQQVVIIMFIKMVIG